MKGRDLHGRGKPARTIFYGWYIVLAAFIANFMGTGLGFYIFNAFIEPLSALRGWTRTDINIGPMLGYIVSIIATVFYGSIVTRAGARLIMTVSSIMTALSFFLMGISDDLYLFYLLYMLMMTGIGGMNGIVSSTVVNNWFIASRGRAMGIATAAISLSGVVLTPIALLILERTGLEGAFISISIGIAAVAPLMWLVLRNSPEEMGLLPDGAVSSGAGRPDADPAPARWTFTRSLKDGNFWKIGIAYALSMASVLGVMFQLKPRFSDLGFESKTAMGLMAGTALAGTAGKYFWAFLCDRFSAKNVTALLMICNGAGLFIMLAVNSLPSAILFVVFYGFAMGGVVSTQPVLIAEVYGRASFPSVARYIAILVGIDCVGYPVMGKSFDITGSYDTAYMFFIACNLVAAALAYRVRHDS